MRDGVRVTTCLFDAARWHNAVKVSCGWCPNFALFEPVGLWWLFERRGWDHSLRQSRERFYCRICFGKHRKKHRPKSVEGVADEPVICLPLPDEREWKRATRRMRS